MRARVAGVSAALESLGLDKLAGWGDAIKRFMIGHPGEFMRQAGKGTLLSKGGLMRSSFVPRSVSDALFSYGLPLALGGLGVAQAPAGQRGQAVGSLLGGLVGSSAGAPLGLVGNMVGGTLGAQGGEVVGKMFDRSGGTQPTQPDVAHAPIHSAPPLQPTGPTLSDRMSEVTGRPTHY